MLNQTQFMSRDQKSMTASSHCGSASSLTACGSAPRESRTSRPSVGHDDDVVWVDHALDLSEAVQPIVGIMFSVPFLNVPVGFVPMNNDASNVRIKWARPRGKEFIETVRGCCMGWKQDSWRELWAELLLGCSTATLLFGREPFENDLTVEAVESRNDRETASETRSADIWFGLGSSDSSLQVCVRRSSLRFCVRLVPNPDAVSRMLWGEDPQQHYVTRKTALHCCVARKILDEPPQLLGTQPQLFQFLKRASTTACSRCLLVSDPFFAPQRAPQSSGEERRGARYTVPDCGCSDPAYPHTP